MSESEIQLPKKCLECSLWKVGDYGTKDFGKILCYNSCPHRKEAKNNLNEWLK